MTDRAPWASDAAAACGEDWAPDDDPRQDAYDPIDPQETDPPSRGAFYGAQVNTAEEITDASLAEELGIREWDENARYVADWDCWLFWDGSRWVRAPFVVAIARVRDFLKVKAAEIRADAVGDNTRKADKLVRELRSHRTTTAVYNMARSNWSSIASQDAFDSDHLLLGTPGGTVDLKTGILRAAMRSDMITKSTAVTPAPKGTHAPIWTRFLESTFPDDNGDPDRELISFMQRAAGYAITGLTEEHKLLFLYGRGRNGKGTFVNTLVSICAEYGLTVGSDIFVQQQFQRHRESIAQLHGRRLVAANELPKGATWNDDILKSLTGGDEISANFMRQNSFTFRPQSTLFISGNNRPAFKGVDTAMRERFLLVPFRATFLANSGKQDPRLQDKLRAEWPAILRWAIDGAVEWRRQGLNPPQVVKQASAEYMDDEDAVANFISEYLVPDPDAKTATSEIYPAFRTWREAQGAKQWTQTAMTRALGEEGNVEVKRTRPSSRDNPTSCVIGFRLKTGATFP
ncbi:DNA primase family protein [Paracoccus saliphilus]|uniref:DNA primase/helicase n=1 Tax=Paracoccus saliphilus TaxID=405559 RepID=A0AA45W300_9RHOB|nr:phage/plasmid primase, P4 family [Paracoccus saliphilus]WCR04992.1 hypothetical protein JHX88_09920 [Paracoccus saliphilus]SIS71612.1 putative DNA primase/helicase [Paracoccus saliphilus]